MRKIDTDIMGILNVTPDSFYDVGEYSQKNEAVKRAEEIVENGADIVDVGGESTRPGAKPVSVEEEIRRVIPVIDDLDLEVPISIDTRNPETARKALEAGADIVNDVTGLENPEMRTLIAEEKCRAVLMDSRNVPVSSSKPGYGENVVEQVKTRLQKAIAEALEDGINEEQIIIDPGIGFGKTPEEDGELIANTDSLKKMGSPVMIGCSRKSFFEGIMQLSLEERLEPSLAANVIGL